MSVSAFGVEHGEISKAGEYSDGQRSMRSQGLAFKDKDARKRTSRDVRANARIIRQGPHTKENRSTYLRPMGHGAAGGAALGAAAGALTGHGAAGRALNAAAGAVGGGELGAIGGGYVGENRVVRRAVSRGRKAGVSRGDITPGHAPATVGLFTGRVKRKYRTDQNVGKSAFGVEHIEKADHRRDESTLTATYDSDAATVNQHARNGSVRTAGSRSPIRIGNQRTEGGIGAGAKVLHRSRVLAAGMRPIPKGKMALGAAGVGAAGAGAYAAHRRHKPEVQKSAFGVEHPIEKGLLKNTGLIGAGGVVGAELASPGVISRPLGTAVGKTGRALKLLKPVGEVAEAV